ncbi:hypothetical protein ROZALSC1DRAFT_30199 [Rozella allomycis CSF55]|uniref:Uncharacterized protein n=1 Tax=Rozella allomycis (strain CSF55) TaxID=988480 RepID=A0A4P9YFP4_ROZAC|nr:hypothetical protein ROZALSC1DRAFT_30199 [Rozella allomycis CSF55]
MFVLRNMQRVRPWTRVFSFAKSYSTTAKLPVPSRVPLSDEEIQSLQMCLKTHNLKPEELIKGEVDVVDYHEAKYLVVGVDYDEADEKFDPAKVSLEEAMENIKKYDNVGKKLLYNEAAYHKFLGDFTQELMSRGYPGSGLVGPIDEHSGLFKKQVYEKFAEAKIEWFKGDTTLQKSNRMFTWFGFFSYLLANQYFPVHDQLLELSALFFAMRFMKKFFFGDQVVASINTHSNERETFMNPLTKQFAEMGKNANKFKTFALFGKMNEDLFSMIKENLKEEGKLMELKEKNVKLTEIKSQLDRRARQDVEKKRQERIEILQTLHARVLERIKDESFQEKFLAQCLSDLKNLATKAK